MQIKVFVNPDGDTFVEVIDPSDGAVTHTVPLDAEQQVVVTAPTAASPADLQVGEVEPIEVPAPESEAPEPAPETAAANEEKVAEQPDPPTSDPDPEAAGDAAEQGEEEAPHPSDPSEKPGY